MPIRQKVVAVVAAEAGQGGGTAEADGIADVVAVDENIALAAG